MEQGTFRDPAVAGKLEERYVEARIHTDHPERPQQAELQLEMTQSVAQPIYLIIDPQTGEQHGRVDGALVGDFKAMLDSAWENAGRDKHASAK